MRPPRFFLIASPMPNPAPFVERQFELHGSVLAVRLYMPTATPHGDFECRWEILWPQCAQHAHAVGLDGVQALLLAWVAVRAELTASPAYQDGKLTYLGSTDLDFPSPGSPGGACLPPDTDQ